MTARRLWTLLGVFIAISVLVSACGTPTAAPTEAPAAAPTEAPAAGSSFSIPDIEAGKFNVGLIDIGYANDGGWSQAHTEGALWMATQDSTIAVKYLEAVPPGPDAEAVMRSLARKGFDMIIGSTFEYGPTMEALAEEFPKVNFLHVSGFRSNGTNYGNLFGAMEDMKYLAGMVAGARAKADGITKFGYVAPWPLPEVIRLGNAFMIGAKVTCPECTMDIRWINTWHDPQLERDGAASLFDAGAQVVFTGADTPAVAQVAEEKGKWAVTYDHPGSCHLDSCLTAPYWIWGPEYARIAEQVKAGTYTAGYEYFDADSGSMGLFGFMEGETPQPGIADLPEEDVQLVKDTLAKMLAGEFDRFDVFAGPIVDNQGNEILAEGERMEQSDLDQFPPGAPGSECETCMYWWADGVNAELPDLG